MTYSAPRAWRSELGPRRGRSSRHPQAIILHLAILAPLYQYGAATPRQTSKCSLPKGANAIDRL